MMIQIIYGTKERMKVSHVGLKRIKNSAAPPLWLLPLITRIFGPLPLHSKLTRDKGLPAPSSRLQRQTVTEFPEQQPPKILLKDTFQRTSRLPLYLTTSGIPLDVTQKIWTSQIYPLLIFRTKSVIRDCWEKFLR